MGRIEIAFADNQPIRSIRVTTEINTMNIADNRSFIEPQINENPNYYISGYTWLPGKEAHVKFWNTKKLIPFNHYKEHFISFQMILHLSCAHENRVQLSGSCSYYSWVPKRLTEALDARKIGIVHFSMAAVGIPLRPENNTLFLVCDGLEFENTFIS